MGLSVKILNKKIFKDSIQNVPLMNKPRAITHRDSSLEALKNTTDSNNQMNIAACKHYVELTRAALTEGTTTLSNIIQIIIEHTKMGSLDPITYVLRDSFRHTPSFPGSEFIQELGVMLEDGRLDPATLTWLNVTPTATNG